MIVPVIFPFLPHYEIHVDPPFERWLCGFLREPKHTPCSHVTFDYYGGRWRIDCFIGVKLYWVNSMGEDMEYKSSWNDWRNDKKSVIHIMENHPNLRHVRHQLKLDGKLRDRPRIIKRGR